MKHLTITQLWGILITDFVLIVFGSCLLFMNIEQPMGGKALSCLLFLFVLLFILTGYQIVTYYEYRESRMK